MQTMPEELWRGPRHLSHRGHIVALLMTSFAMFPDPFIRHDDFPALLADPDGYYIKTLDEGRWLSYIWHLRGFVMPSWLAFTLYQLCWAIFAGAAAPNACGPNARPIYPIAVALFIMVAPPAAMISVWFNTLLPGLAVVAVYARWFCAMARGNAAMAAGLRTRHADVLHVLPPAFAGAAYNRT